MEELEEFPVDLQDFKLSSKSMLAIKNCTLRAAALFFLLCFQFLGCCSSCLSLGHGHISSPWKQSLLQFLGSLWTYLLRYQGISRLSRQPVNFQCCPNLLPHQESKFWFKKTSLRSKKNAFLNLPAPVPQWVIHRILLCSGRR